KHVLCADIRLESRRQSSPDSVATDYGLRTTDFKIGIAWQGNPHHKRDRQRSIALAEFAALARIPGVELISLQKGSGVEQLHGIAGRFAVVELHGEVDAGAGAFMDTAALMRHLDLV